MNANEMTLEQAMVVLEARGACDTALRWLRSLPEGTTPREALVQADWNYAAWAMDEFVPDHAVWAGYLSKRNAARVEYEAKTEAAFVQYKSKLGATLAECLANHSAVWAEYEANHGAAGAEYLAKREAVVVECLPLIADDLLTAIAAEVESEAA